MGVIFKKDKMTKQKSGRIFLIINNFSGHHLGERAVETVIPVLLKNGYQVEHAFTQYPGHATELASKASFEGFDLVVAVGGDGTVNEAAQGLLGTATPLGIVPVGSGNGLARELGIPINMHKSALVLVRGMNRQIDVWKINNQRFFCASGIGIDALIAYQMSKAASRGFLRYIQLSIKESILYKPLKVRIKIDGQALEQSAFLITFANASQFGNNAFIAPTASMSDGLIDVVVVRPFHKIWLPVFAIALFTKMLHFLPFVKSYKAKKVELEWTDTSLLHYDGEPGKLSVPATITMDPQNIMVRC